VNNGNLISLASRPEADRKRIASMGGKASGAARRAMREEIERLKVAMQAERELNLEEIRELRLAAKELRLAAKAEEQARWPRIPQMPRMPSRIPKGYWDE